MGMNNNLSHILQIQTEVRDPVAIQAACGRLKLPELVFGETKLNQLGGQVGGAVAGVALLPNRPRVDPVAAIRSMKSLVIFVRNQNSVGLRHAH